MLSIVIPAYNEAVRLPKLLASIKKQNFEDYEIIVADNHSKDNTRKIAKKYGCKVVNGGLPPVARNKGAKAAKGDILLFLDSDCVLDDGFLEKSISEFKKRKLDFATSYFKVKGNKMVDKIIFIIGNFLLFITQFIDPHAPGPNIFCTKKGFKKIKGFKENLKQSEDHDLVKRGGKVGKFRILNIRNQFDMRRFEKEGRFRVLSKYIKSEIYRKFKGYVNTDLFKYDYGKY